MSHISRSPPLSSTVSFSFIVGVTFPARTALLPIPLTACSDVHSTTCMRPNPPHRRAVSTYLVRRSRRSSCYRFVTASDSLSSCDYDASPNGSNRTASQLPALPATYWGRPQFTTRTRISCVLSSIVVNLSLPPDRSHRAAFLLSPARSFVTLPLPSTRIFFQLGAAKKRRLL